MEITGDVASMSIPLRDYFGHAEDCNAELQLIFGNQGSGFGTYRYAAVAKGVGEVLKLVDHESRPAAFCLWSHQEVLF